MLCGRCYELERALPYQPLAEALHAALPALPDDDPAAFPKWALDEVARLAVTLHEGAVHEALGYARSLIDPDQQPPRIPLEGSLEEAIAAGDEGQMEAARGHLVGAVEIAQEMGYL